MTQDEIIRMMKEAGFYFNKTDAFMPEWEQFASLVADAKKQQLIDLCEREIEQLSINNDAGHVSRFDEGLYAAYHTILKGLLA